jgi:hypothetical protein
MFIFTVGRKPMFDIIFNEFGVAWTAAAVGTLLVPVLLLVAWKTAALAAEVVHGRKLHRAHATASTHGRARKALSGPGAIPPRRRTLR